MRADVRGIAATTPLLLTAMLVACGGGGAGGSTGGGSVLPTTPSGGSTPTSTPTVKASATPTATPTPAGVSYAGTIVDADAANAPLAGATVTFGNGGFTNGNITTPIATVTTAADGTFSANLTSTPTFIQVVGASGGTGAAGQYASLHRFAMPAEGTLALTKISADEAAVLVQVNADRVKYGTSPGLYGLTPSQNPVYMDLDALVVARDRANQMATTGVFAHSPPTIGSLAFAQPFFNAIPGTLSTGKGYLYDEDLNAGANSLVQAENSFISEGQTGGHFQSIVSSKVVFMGFGEAFNGKPDPSFQSPPGVTVNYFCTTPITTSP